MKSKQAGLTLIEMMIAMVIGLLIVGTVITIFITNVRSNSDNVSMIRLNQELRGLMTFISDELKRSGYSADPDEDAFIDDLNFDAGSSCLRYSYDENGNGTQGADERFGLQWTGNQVQWTNQVTSNICAGSGWQAITDTDIASITGFTVIPSPIVAITAGSAEIYTITVTITGTTGLSGGTTASRTIREVIRIRNEDA